MAKVCAGGVRHRKKCRHSRKQVASSKFAGMIQTMVTSRMASLPLPKEDDEQFAVGSVDMGTSLRMFQVCACAFIIIA